MVDQDDENIWPDLGHECYQIWISPTKYPGKTFSDFVSEFKMDRILYEMAQPEILDGPPIRFKGSYQSELPMHKSLKMFSSPPPTHTKICST